MIKKCIEKPTELECFQWFSNLKEFPEWFVDIPYWFVESLDNGYWIVKEYDRIVYRKKEKFEKYYQLIGENK